MMESEKNKHTCKDTLCTYTKERGCKRACPGHPESTGVSTQNSKAYSALMLSMIESLLKRVENFHSNMLRQYNAHTESFDDCPER